MMQRFKRFSLLSFTYISYIALEICIQSVLREVLLMAVRGRFFEDCNRIRYSGKAQ